MTRRRGKEAAGGKGTVRPALVLEKSVASDSDLATSRDALNACIQARRQAKINQTKPEDWVTCVRGVMDIAADAQRSDDQRDRIAGGNLYAKAASLLADLERDAYEAADAKGPASMTQININLADPPGGRHEVPGLLDETP